MNARINTMITRPFIIVALWQEKYAGVQNGGYCPVNDCVCVSLLKGVIVKRFVA